MPVHAPHPPSTPPPSAKEKIRLGLPCLLRIISIPLFLSISLPASAAICEGSLFGYGIAAHEKAPETYNAGFSLYAAAWPLLDPYPGHRFQSGLFGTWMGAQHDTKPPGKLYSDIEGGLGWWRDTHFPTPIPKFIMGGVAVNFSDIANGPSKGKGTWDNPKGLYGVAQLSPWLLFPLDGLNLQQGTCGELFGYGYLLLPLIPAKTVTDGHPIPTGDNCWTLFLNTQTFKGPVCFFTPYFWSRYAVTHPEVTGLLLDSCPSAANKGFQMETQHMPAALAASADGESYARTIPVSFPVGPDGRTVLLHRLTCYNKTALWDGVKRWFDGGPPIAGTLNPSGAYIQEFKPRGSVGWTIVDNATPKDQRAYIDWAQIAKTVAIDPYTYGYEWSPNPVSPLDPKASHKVTMPEYFHLAVTERKINAKQPRWWQPVSPDQVPADTGLRDYVFTHPKEKPQEPYLTPETPDSSFRKPGPVAGPFTARLGDGSVVTYYWYRFADQPALLNADLSPEEREALQTRVEKFHRAWSKDRDYLAPPTVGQLASLDPAQIVIPPKGLEVGFVPIATRQELAP